MVNKIWSSFIVLGIIFCIINNNLEGLNRTILESAQISLNMILKIFPVMALWLGIMNIASISGLMQKFSKVLSPFLTKIFPEIPKNHESFSYISSNIIANIFGLGNAATPFGLKAMESLQTLNKQEDTATRSMITFLVINTSSITIIPTTVISLRMMHNSSNPNDIVLACFLATLVSLIAGLLFDRYLAKRLK